MISFKIDSSMSLVKELVVSNSAAHLFRCNVLFGINVSFKVAGFNKARNASDSVLILVVSLLVLSGSLVLFFFPSDFFLEKRK